MNFTDLLEEKKSWNEKNEKHAQAAVGAEFKAFFVRFPWVQSVKWTQYQPGFNDGDATYFSVHADFYGFSEDGIVGDEPIPHRPPYTDDFKRTPEINEWEEKWLKPVRVALGFMTDSDSREIMQAAFGESSEVVATRDGFKVEDYWHD